MGLGFSHSPPNFQAAGGLTHRLVERLREFPRRQSFFWNGVGRLVAVILRIWLRIYHRLRISGRENLPEQGSFVLVANHSSHLDTLCVLAALPLRQLNRTFPAAAADYFFVSLPRMAVAVLVVNAMPFQRQAHVRQTLGICRRLLAREGNVLILYPEG